MYWACLAASLVFQLAGAAHAQPAEAPASDTADAVPVDGAEGEAATEVPAGPDPAVVEEARRRYAQGSEFYRRARYAQAVAEFTEAYSLWPNPTILYALGQAYEGLSEVHRAIETYHRYLEAAPEGDLRRADAAQRIEVLGGLLAVLRIAVNVEAIVSIDGEAVGSAPGDFRVPTGRHLVTLRAEGHEPQSATVTIAGGTERSVSFELEPSPVVTLAERERFRFPRPVFYAAVGLTGASLVVWGAMATKSVVRARDYNDMPGRTNFDRDDAHQYASRSNIALGVTGGLAATTLVIGLLTQWQDDADDDEEEPGGERDGDAAARPPRLMAAVTPLRGGAMLSARWTR